MCQAVFDALKNTMSAPTAFLEISLLGKVDDKDLDGELIFFIVVRSYARARAVVVFCVLYSILMTGLFISG